MTKNCCGRGETATAVLAGPHILVVDDEPIILELVTQILLEAGFRVRTAETGQQAVELVRYDPSIKLTILDWRMPGMSGEQVFDQVTAVRPGVKTIVASGNDRSDVERAFSGRKVDCFLSKPFTPSGLVTLVRSALED